MTDYREAAWLMERVIHKYMQFEKKPQQYCGDLYLTQLEIHTVAIIGDREGINVTQLAKARGITKGAASQMLYRLADKGLVEKRVSPDSDAAVSLFLTEKGKRAHKEHRDRHKTMADRLGTLLSSVSDEDMERMLEFLRAFEASLDAL